MNVIDMFDSPSCETRPATAGGASAGHKRPRLPVDRSSSDDCASDDGIDLIDDVAVGVVGGASRECRTPRRRTMACEMSAIRGKEKSLSLDSSHEA